MKNVIFLVIDSVRYKKTIKDYYRNSPMKFLNKLASDGLNSTKMYSEAPYTEAALVSLLCGVDTFNNGGYMKKLYNKTTIMEVFKNNGYKTFCNCIQPCVYPTYAYPGVTDYYYNICYDFMNLWSYRINYYSNLYEKKGHLEKEEISLLIDLLDDNFKNWLQILFDLKEKNSDVSFIINSIDLSNIDENIELLKEEILKYKKNKEEYLFNLFAKKEDHKLFMIKTYSLDKTLSDEKRDLINKKYKKVVKKIYSKNLRYNFFNNRLNIFKCNYKISVLKSHLNAIFDRDLMSKISNKRIIKKAAPSMYKTIENFKEWYNNLKNNDNYFAYIHVDDCHSPEIFYSYDIADFNQLDKEFNKINKYIDGLPRNYKGNLAYDLSLQYADNCIKNLYNFLEKTNQLNNTIIAICADHGSSYTFDPCRESYVNNVYEENYHIPFVLWSKGINSIKKDGFYNSKDIPATIIDAANLKIPKEYDGISLLKNDGKEYVLLQNVNGGCPDYNNRDFLLGVRTLDYSVVMKFKKEDSFKDGIMYSVFDLKRDKLEKNNINSIIDKGRINKELKFLEKEFLKLKTEIEKNDFLNIYTKESE